MRSPSSRPRATPATRASRPTTEAQALICGRYRIESTLGKGGVGEVYRVTDISLGNQLALKRLSATSSDAVQALFEREYQTLASLKHPHTVAVHEYGRDEDGSFYTMELLEGGDLRERAPMPWREACSVLRDAALALGVLHARELVHRDVSPRNLWRLPDGRVKLIDFGAIVPFGRPPQLIGTPPLVPPEAYHGAPLDQRADLFSLGAVGYFLLSGHNAYPARGMHELPELWMRAVQPPSAAALTLGRFDHELIPAELDGLILALLSQNPLGRPANTAELIDRLDSLLGPAGSAHYVDSADLHLANPAFVGRERERRRLGRLLALAAAGRGQSAILEGDAGIGRTRLLQELGLAARVANAYVLHVDAASYPGMYGVASALAIKLLDALPNAARAAATPYIHSLAHASPMLRDRLRVVLDRPPEIAGELRVRIQSAFVEWFERVASEHTLVLAIDGLELVDDGTAAFLLRLAQTFDRSRILLACTRLRRSGRLRSPAMKALRERSRRLRIEPLSEAQTLELLHSIFGRPEHLIRLANRLHQTARGTPGHILELAEQLVRSESIRFANGTWVLPQEISDELLPSSRNVVLAARLARLNGSERELARALSVQSGAIPDALYHALGAELPARDVSLAILIDAEIMTRDADGLRFAHEQFRTTLLEELSADAKCRALRLLGEYILAEPGSGSLERLRAGVHLVESGNLAAVRVVAASITEITLRDPDRLAPAMPVVERALSLLRAAGRPAHELTTLLAPLAVAGYFVDYKYASTYGDEALALQREVLGLVLANRLRRYCGRTIALIIALTLAGFRFFVRRKSLPSPNFEDALTLMFMSVSTLSASSGLCYDYETTRRAAAVLEPFGGLGAKFAPAFSYDVCCGLAIATRDTFGESHARWRTVVALLESASPIYGLPDNLRVRYLSGLVFAQGIMDSQRDDDSALKAAERLDRMGIALYPMSTDQLRAMYYAHHGDAKLYAHYRECAEQRAIQQGAIWQNETWTLLVETIVALRHYDAMGMKRVAEQLRSASAVIPTLAVFADRSRGAYLLLRGRPQQALPWLEKCLAEETRANFGWGRSHGVLARAYNELGRYREARDACLRVLNEFTPADLEFPGLTLIIETERWIAEAGLGNLERARAGFAALFDRHGPNRGPLTQAELHEAGVRISLLARDAAQAREHIAEMTRWYESTTIPSIIQHCHSIRANAELTLSGRPPAPVLHLALAHTSRSTMFPSLSIRSTTSGDPFTVSELTQRALHVLAEQSRASQGYLFWVNDERCSLAASLATERLADDVERWLVERVIDACAETTTVLPSSDEGAVKTEPDVLLIGARAYRVLFLHHADARGDNGVYAAAVLSNDGPVPDRCSPQLLQAISAQLHQGLVRTRSEVTTAS